MFDLMISGINVSSTDHERLQLMMHSWKTGWWFQKSMPHARIARVWPSEKWLRNGFKYFDFRSYMGEISNLTNIFRRSGSKPLASGSAGPPGGCYSSRELGDPSKKHQALAGAALL